MLNILSKSETNKKEFIQKIHHLVKENNEEFWEDQFLKIVKVLFEITRDEADDLKKIATSTILEIFGAQETKVTEELNTIIEEIGILYNVSKKVSSLIIIN